MHQTYQQMYQQMLQSRLINQIGKAKGVAVRVAILVASTASYGAVSLLATQNALAAKERDPAMTSSGELLEWCEQESKAALLAQGLKPYNWTASHWDEAETLFVKGSWRSGTKELVVECQVGRGVRRSNATMSLHNK